jgi:hypothetical protein
MVVPDIEAVNEHPLVLAIDIGEPPSVFDRLNDE